jgi:outer membrane protein OmpA-like peptidoglycan-associated protein
MGNRTRNQKQETRNIIMKTICLLISFLFAVSTLNAQGSDSISVYFPFDKAYITTEARSKLDGFIQQFKSGRSGGQLVINGFCDVIGPHPYNDQLSVKRTLSVQQYLERGGIPSTAISVRKGYGKRAPVNDNSTASERQENRRVDIIWNTTGQPVSTTTPAPEFSIERMDSIKEGETLRLRNINFIGGRHTFLPQAAEPLRELLAVMKKYPTLVIEIQGHICCFENPTGDAMDYDANDMNLSLNRAKAVYDYLVDNGIDASRMSYKGFSRKFPLVDPEITEEDKTTNRRVEIKIIRK